MDRAWWAAQLFGAAVGIAGLYIIHDSHIIIGLLLVLWGNNLQRDKMPGNPKPDIKDKNWVEK